MVNGRRARRGRQCASCVRARRMNEASGDLEMVRHGGPKSATGTKGVARRVDGVRIGCPVEFKAMPGAELQFARGSSGSPPIREVAEQRHAYQPRNSDATGTAALHNAASGRMKQNQTCTFRQSPPSEYTFPGPAARAHVPASRRVSTRLGYRSAYHLPLAKRTDDFCTDR